MHIKRQQKVKAPDRKTAEKVCKFKCSNPGCRWVFGNKHGLQVHKGKWCKWKNFYEVERILDMECDKLPTGISEAQFLVKWQGYDHDANQWVSYENITKAAIVEYLQANGKYDYGWEHRCKVCDRPFKTARGMKIHYTKTCKKKEKHQHYEGTCLLYTSPSPRD